jgi:hypothetical protein
MNNTKDNKVTHQRNITPNFLKFKSTHFPIQENQPPKTPRDKMKELKLSIQLKEAHQRQVAPALTSTKKEC